MFAALHLAQRVSIMHQTVPQTKEWELFVSVYHSQARLVTEYMHRTQHLGLPCMVVYMLLHVPPVVQH